MTIADAISSNYLSVRLRIDAACRRAGRDPKSVTLVAVTKYAQVEWVRCLVEHAAAELGESRPQQLVQRAHEISAPVHGYRIHWHLIGNLQRNKVRSILPHVTLLHAADSLRLLESIDRIAQEIDLRPRVLLEVSLCGEEAKHGFQADELLSEWDQLQNLERVRSRG